MQDRLSITLEDALVLIYHLQMGNGLPDVGYEDTEILLNEILAELNKSIYIKVDTLERALWSTNMMRERGFFWHPKGRSFNDFIARMLPNFLRFDRKYNLIVERNKNNART